MNKDNYGEIINGQETYNEIARMLSSGMNVLIGWTEGKMSHFDIMFSYKMVKFYGGELQGGVSPSHDLFVSIMRVGAFSFDATQKFELSPDYIAEKLDGRGYFFRGITGDKLAELINGVIKALK